MRIMRFLGKIVEVAERGWFCFLVFRGRNNIVKMIYGRIIRIRYFGRLGEKY